VAAAAVMRASYRATRVAAAPAAALTSLPREIRDTQCWWYLHPRQTREHLLKGCPKWRKQQRVLWKEVWKETGKERGRLKAHELFVEQEAN